MLFHIFSYIVTIENEDDYNEFMENIVDRSNPDHMCAYDALKDNLLGECFRGIVVFAIICISGARTKMYQFSILDMPKDERQQLTVFKVASIRIFIKYQGLHLINHLEKLKKK